MSRLARRLLIAAVLVGLVAVGGTLGVRALLDRLHLPIGQEARCDIVGSAYSVSTDQAANAATVTAVAVGRGLPRRAAVIALATALQESKLVDVEYGDRDSVGLFQQRPSQGWGTAAQILDPHYAAGKFYDALVRVRDWQHRRLTEVAQAVQHSGDPAAYQQWEGLADALEKPLDGTTPAGLNCSFPAPTVASTPARVVQLLSRDLPATPLPGSTRVGVIRATANGWAAATWLVAHADQFGLDSVDFRTNRWTRADGWRPQPDAGQDQIRFETAQVSAASH